MCEHSIVYVLAQEANACKHDRHLRNKMQPQERKEDKLKILSLNPVVIFGRFYHPVGSGVIILAALSGYVSLPKFWSRSIMILRAFRLLICGREVWGSVRVRLVSCCCVPLSDATVLPGKGNNVCKSSYPASVKPNCGDERNMRAGPPLKKAFNPSCWRMVCAQWRSVRYWISPLRASTCRRVLMTSHGVVKYAAGIPATAPAASNWKIPSFFWGPSPK